ncbi:8-amino-7-oxononanoate synthase [Brenneria tiliae]|uniref:8-amino-7-oxononanoate synthase n=1 Tax=Brenneria tiliae TaxID=2914984 RepID=UPI002014EDAC|nr:8-amino-7-oxononanoate synthase [Brenneria tiliae]MCL2895898.1 8-amino-7-oxononanoate synthase [Brenneria tiliae]MCL2900449.1 8-amino-7-oxononanoate synthase [Brenneria tiliae]
MSWQRRIALALEQRRQDDAYRTRRANQGGNGRWLTQDGRRYLNFSSNDYLGLSRHPEIIHAWRQGAQRYGVGSGGSGHVTGYTDAHETLEQQLAEWLGYPRALLFISGYAANQAVVAALTQAGDRILADRLSHASLLEAAAHSPATLRRFSHNDHQALRRLLAKPAVGQTLAVTEGVFSMDGDSAPLPQLHALCRERGAWLMVDDAHGVGVLGEEGRGSCWRRQVRPELLIVTFGKAFGVSGAAVLCAEPPAEYLLQFARHLIYSTAMPAAQACALSAALNCVRQGEALREALRRNIAQFRAGCATSSWRPMDSDSAIQPLLVGDNARTLALMTRMRAQGIWVTAMRPPTVPPGSARLRITLTAAHRPEDIEQLLTVLRHAD